MFHLKILILEDDFAVAKMLSNVFSDENRCVISSKYEVAKSYLNTSFDVLLIDILLKGDDKTGLDFAREYKKLYPNATIIAMSAYEHYKIQKDVIDYFFTKPLDIDELKRIVEIQKTFSIKKIADQVEKLNSNMELIKKHLGI